MLSQRQSRSSKITKNHAAHGFFIYKKYLLVLIIYVIITLVVFQGVSTLTEYRIVTLRTFIGDRYLQFKSTRMVRCSPYFWNTKEVECWRFVPEERLYPLYRFSEHDCPITLPYAQEDRYLNCFHKQEDYSVDGVMWFPQKYPNIRVYFAEMNAKHDEYLEQERLAGEAGTTHLNSYLKVG